ncbi:MAG: hypothetical protein F9K30_16105 [Dechloromonas sp.]|nr:MAG: hypothetical protein F9K30_16105 [Dechloromonas sp.]
MGIFIKTNRFIQLIAMLLIMGEAMASDAINTLKAQFIYRDDIADASEAIRAICPSSDKGAKTSEMKGKGRELTQFVPILSDVLVSFAGKAVESIIDSAAAKTQPEATVLETTIPLDGFYDNSGDIAPSGGCLIFHNAPDDNLSDASLLASFVLFPSSDKSAFRFDVNYWKFSRFLKEESSSWFQEDGIRDFILKIEFLTPGSSGLGTRSVFVEHVFSAMSAKSLSRAFTQGQKLPWFSSPPKLSGGMSDTSRSSIKYLPLNIKISVVETTKANQIAQWVQDIAKEKKSDFSAAVKDALKKSLDESYAAADDAKQVDLASVAYSAYKATWDEMASQKAAKPKDVGAAASQPDRDKHEADMLAWRASMTVKLQLVAGKRTIARAAFSNANLSWPGDLPSISID